MNARDIVPGNWYMHNDNWNTCGYNGPFQFEENDWYSIGECLLSLDDIEQIPITDDILLVNCGLRPVDNSIFNTGEYEFGNIKLGYVAGAASQWQISYNGMWIDRIINYIDELQNLIYILTKKELEVKF